ncbi:hypothetical protein [Caenimonas aquaedulcis]|uniref:Uncharacterized protein n=1 Tax=Caenimonas aquaedulcis TaxID=2793270 RepID=A0A931H6I8_9BURK|nr:hypothetical protein [Caenimonas aquaedulcis]MBG9389571.1 hypothetical protein [Caenimonas aquaedulcis]
MLARADELSVLLPLDGIGAINYVAGDLSLTEVPGLFAAGEEGRSQLIVAPSRRLRPLADFPKSRFVLTPMAFTGSTIHIAWSDVRVLIGAQFNLMPLPEALDHVDAPVDGYVLVAGRPAFRSDSRRLLEFMLSGEGPHDRG